MEKRSRRNKVFGSREKNTVVKCTAVLQDLYERYVQKHKELLETYAAAEQLKTPVLLEAEMLKLERALEKMEAEILDSVAPVYGALLGLTPQEVVRGLRRRSYAAAAEALGETATSAVTPKKKAKASHKAA